MNLKNEIVKLIKYIESKNYKWYDPYDLKWLWKYIHEIPILRNIVFVAEYNFWYILRKLIKIEKKINNKSLWLILRSYIMINNKWNYNNKIIKLYNYLSKNNDDSIWLSWGYPFVWYSKLTFNKNLWNAAATIQVWKAFVLLYEKNYSFLDNKIIKKQLENIFKYFKNNWKWQYFSYTKKDKMNVMNINIQIFNFITLLYKNKILSKNEVKNYYISFKNVINKQNPDWSFFYMEWSKNIDNYHTWILLEDLYEICINLNILDKYKNTIKKWLNYYTEKLFLNDSFPILTESNYEINIHSISQSIITLTKLKSIKNNNIIVNNILKYTFEKMYDNEKNYFYYKDYSLQYKKYNIFKKIILFKKIDKTPMMRRSQSWMLLSLIILKNSK